MSIYLGDTPIAVNSSSREIGEIIQSTIPLSDAGLHLLDGSIISGSGSYSAFVTYIAGLVSSYPDLFETEANWQTSVTNYGVCGKFVYDSVNNTVRLPKITGFTEGTIDPTVLGDLVQAGLPNITGYNSSIYLPTTESRTSGAISRYSSGDTGSNYGSTSSTAYGYGFNLDASLSNSIYGNSTTVQPQSIKVLYYIVIATSTKTDIEVDIDEVMTDLNGKVDLADLAPCQVVIEAYRNGSDWYRVYSDGWVEQGGNISMYSSGSNITLHKNFRDTNYNVQISFGGTDYRSDTPSIYNKTTSLFKVTHNAGLNNGFSLYWEAKGMGA